MAWITPLIAFVLGLVGLIGLFGKGSLGSMARSLTAWVPVGNPKLWSIVLIVAGLFVFGGFAYGQEVVTGLVGKTSTAGLTPGEDVGVVTSDTLTCRFDTAPTEGTPGTQNITFRADDSKLSNYFVDVKYDSGGHVINGTIYCESSGPVSVERAHVCYAKSDVFRDQLASDSTDYYWVATTNTVSIVPGLPWKQLIDIRDSGTSNTVATASDPDEQTQLVYADGDAYNYLGFNLTLFDTQAEFDQLKNQSQGTVHFVCDGSDVATLTIVRATA